MCDSTETRRERSCEPSGQPLRPRTPIARGRAGPKLLAHILFAKFGLHLPLNRQSAVYAREGIDLDVSPLTYWAGAAAVPLIPLVEAIRARAHLCRHNRAGGQREV
jgi:transposase